MRFGGEWHTSGELHSVAKCRAEQLPHQAQHSSTRGELVGLRVLKVAHVKFLAVQND